MAYQQRSPEALPPLAKSLVTDGILAVDDVYSVAELARINAVMDPIFAAKSSQARAYVRPDEMMDSGILDTVLSIKMRTLIFSLVQNAVLFHFHAYEIAGNSTKSHIFSESLNGWHRDPDSGFYVNDPTHLSIFVYLKDVGADDGSFEFSPHRPDAPLRTDSPVLTMVGPAGMTFVWHRSYYHRASPNRGPRRRRLIKFSVQPNEFHSAHLTNDFFKRVCAEAHLGNTEFDLLFGRYQGKSAPRLAASTSPRAIPLWPNSTINIPENVLAGLKVQEADDARKPVAYD